MRGYAALLRAGVTMNEGVRGVPTLEATHYCLAEMDGDGIEELIVYAKHYPEAGEWSFAVFAWQEGRVRQIADSVNTCDISQWGNAGIDVTVENGILDAYAQKASANRSSSSSNRLYYDGETVHNYKDGDRPPETGVENNIPIIRGLESFGIEIGSADDTLLALAYSDQPTPAPVPTAAAVLTDGDYYGRPITWNDSTMTLELLEFAGRHPDSLNYMLNPTGQTVTLDISDASIYLDFAWAQETVKCLSFDDALSYRPWDGRDTILDYMGGPPDLSFTVKNGRITEMILLYAA